MCVSDAAEGPTFHLKLSKKHAAKTNPAPLPGETHPAACTMYKIRFVSRGWSKSSYPVKLRVTFDENMVQTVASRTGMEPAYK